ncbi:hypothetical protein FXF51_03295 [Nonomuraea sp. PA05]|uniref:DUF7144 family membrane protein n=1 Tax=Nonomuraea sp. PA05 TaxID=2604466 RepID=UPI0011D6F35A|nr:hypothetical protein [Nonomuraea sp. PA05]TYB70120.1 hypothetical protein FXF51_03295 [Nonomuraea sp. PA05]
MTGKTYSPKRQSWVAGAALFAAIMMITVGFFQALEGIAAIIANEFYVPTRNYIYVIDVTAWGWIHLVLGVAVGVAGWGVMVAQLWARIVGIAAAVLSAVANFFFIPYYPFWAMLIIALDIFIIWTLCVYGKREAREAGMRES